MTDLPLSVWPANEAGELRRSRIAADLARLIEGDVRFGRHERMLYSTDASIYQVEPIGVIVPRSIQDVERVVLYCGEHGIPILPRGGGTSLAGQAVNEAVVVDFSACCNQLLEVSPESRTVRVEPGIVLAHLNRALEPHGLMFGPDVATATHANLGGMIGNNSAGAHSILHGRTVEHLLALDVLLADGTRLHLAEGGSERDERVRQITEHVAQIIEPLAENIDQHYPKIRRHVGGYNFDLLLDQIRRSSSGTYDRVNLAHLFCGSEGTLGVTVEATLNLVPVPKRKGLAIIAFPDVDAALAAVAPILEASPAAVELVDDVVIGLAKQNTECRRYVELMPKYPDGSLGTVLYVEYFANEADELRARIENLADLLPNNPQRTFTDPVSMAQAWQLRASGEPLLYGLPGKKKPLTFVEDAAVDPKDLPAFIHGFRDILDKHDTTAAYYAHASVGCLHVRPMINLHDPNDLEKMRSISMAVNDLVMQFGGTISGEHGDGRLRSHLLERFYGPDICNGFRRIKEIFDPKNLMNPGIITDAPPMTERLRVNPSGRDVAIPSIATYFKYEREQGFGAAVEMCNGAGVCRKTSGGTMCPSYRALLDERHATRGRGNALRLAISGQLSEDGLAPAWNDPETMHTLDLCLSCKACKSECPSNVDIARLKAEYLAQSYDNDGSIPVRSRLFAYVRPLNRIGSMSRAIANPLSRWKPMRRLMERLLGIDSRRSLPRFEKPLAMDSNERENASGKPCVILYPDCFTAYNEPRIAEAAKRVLEALGYRVVIPRIGCCGRAAISNGLLPDAIDMASETALSLVERIKSEEAIAVLGCEPSCVSAIVDDWVDLKLKVDAHAASILKQHTLSVEDFIESRWDEHRSPLRPLCETSGPPVLLHGHCHQKALWGIDHSVALLRRFVGNRLQPIDAGCCGMAGSFGYTTDHYDLSMAIGELALFPAVREAADDAIILAPGTSCRHQIHDGVNRRALHPIELIEQAVSN